MNAFTFTVALIMGFTGSLHCAGMCGPIILVMPFQALSGYRKWLAVALYHLGRISTYALLAIALYSFRSLFSPHIQQYISIGLGVLLLLAGLLSFLPNHKLRIVLPWSDEVKKSIGNFIGRPGVSTFFITGLLNGLLPCGLVYMALSAAINAPTVMAAVGFMYLFGLGTTPMLVSITILKKRLAILKGDNFKRFVPVVMFVFGALFVLRGMNLGIPYVSPRILVDQHTVKASCCHHKK